MIPKKKIVHFLFVSLAILYSLAISRECHADAYAYITNSGSSDNVLEIRLSNTADIRTLSAGTDPFGVAVAPDGRFVYITNQTSGNVSVISTRDNSDPPLLPSYTTGDNPKGIAVSPDGEYLYVADDESGGNVSIIKIDNTDNKIDVSVGTNPYGVAVTPAGDFVYVTDGVENKVYILDTSDPENPTISAQIDDVGTAPRGIAITPSGSYTIVANSGDGTVDIITTSNNLISDTITVGNSPFGVAIMPDESYAYVTNTAGGASSTGSVFRIDLTDPYFSFEDLADVVEDPPGLNLNFPQGVAISADGGFVYIVNQGNNSVEVLDTETNTVSTITGSFSSPVSLGNFIGGTPPDAPLSLVATLTNDNQITLEWTHSFVDLDGYKIIRKRYADGTYTLIATIDDPLTTTYVDSGLGYNSNYYYMVCAYNLAGDSDYSDEAYATTEKEDESGCFIATAAYGSFMAPQVKVLRKFRDRFMTTNTVGKFFLNVYYKYSPPIAEYIAEHDSLRVFIRWALLPFVGMSWLFLNLGPGLTLLCFVLCFSLLCTAAVFRFKRRKI